MSKRYLNNLRTRLNKVQQEWKIARMKLRLDYKEHDAGTVVVFKDFVVKNTLELEKTAIKAEDIKFRLGDHLAKQMFPEIYNEVQKVSVRAKPKKFKLKDNEKSVKYKENND